jgi:hypothetical protein
MKRVLGTFVGIVVVCGAALAQSPFKVSVDTVADVFYMRSFTGEYAENDKKTTENPYKYQGETNIMRSFQTSAFDDGLVGQVSFSYTDDWFGASLGIKGGTAESNAEGTSASVTGAIRSTSASSGLSLSGWSLWLGFKPFEAQGGELEPFQFKLTAGTGAQRGKVSQYIRFDDFLKARVDPMGVLMPVWRYTSLVNTGNNYDVINKFPNGYTSPQQSFGFTEFAGTDTNDLFMPAGSTIRRSGFLLDLGYAPVTVSASLGGLLENLVSNASTWYPIPTSEATRLPDYYDTTHQQLINRKLNFGFRAEGDKIADMLTLSAVYKFAQNFISKGEAEDERDEISLTIDNHAFGLYADIKPIKGLGITVGYSGFVRSWKNLAEKTALKDTSASVVENVYYDDDLVFIYYAKQEVDFPFYSGIDLRFSADPDWLEVPLSITLNNNFSFAGMNGTENATTTRSIGWAYTGELNRSESAEYSERYFGMNNVLALSYTVTKTLTAQLQAANQLGLFTLQWDNDPVHAVTDYTGLYAGAVLTIYGKNNAKASIRGGVACKISSFSYQAATIDAPEFKAGYIDFGFPLGLMVEF